MRFFKSRLFLSGLCLLISGILAFGIVPRLYEDKSATVPVIKVNKMVLSGTKIEEADLVEVTVGAFGLPSSVVTDKKILIGKYAKTALYSDDLILTEKISDYKADAVLDAVMHEDKRLVTITLPSMAAGVSSHLQAGDLVSVVSFTPAKEQQTLDGFISQPGKVILTPELKLIQVYGIENASTESTEIVKERKDTSSNMSDDPVPKTITLIVTEAQALKLIEAEYTGKLHILFVKRGDIQ